MLLGLAAASVVAALLSPPIPQDPAYHRFADGTRGLGLPNFWNVVSNIPFLLVGLAGVHDCARTSPPGILQRLRPAYVTFFAGIACIGPGSVYYHWAPDNTSLLWDRLPMTIAFMAFSAIIIGEHFSQDLGRKLLWPLVLLGILSVLYWAGTEALGRGDLRPYALVQFLPMILIPLVLLWFPPALEPTAYLWGMLAAYLVAKVLEWLDARVFELLAPLSGHSLKHLVAALGAYFFLLAIRRRRPTNPS